jgi:hypothetical protein
MGRFRQKDSAGRVAWKPPATRPVLFRRRPLGLPLVYNPVRTRNHARGGLMGAVPIN